MVDEVGRDHQAIKKRIMDTQINKDHLKSMQGALAKISEIVHKLQVQTLQVGQMS